MNNANVIPFVSRPKEVTEEELIEMILLYDTSMNRERLYRISRAIAAEYPDGVVIV